MIQKLRIHISQLFIVLLVLLSCISTTIWEDKASFLPPILFLLGIFLVSIATLGRLWCSIYIAGYKTDHLVTQGPYSMCRNPLYFFSLVGAIGVGLASETISIPIVILLGYIAYYPLVIKSEEIILLRLHKIDFENYIKEVPRFFPKVSLLKEPDQYVIKPIVFRRHMFDALWFVWIVGILETIEGLHELGVLPKLFKIY